MEPIKSNSRNELNKCSIELLAIKYGDQLKMFIMKHSHDADVVDDIVQSTYLEALKNRHQFRGEAKIKTWLFGIAFNLVRNQNRIKYRKPYCISLDNSSVYYINDGYDINENVNSHRLLNKCPELLSSMPTEMRKVFELTVMDGFKYEETALELGIAVGTVRSRLSRARSWLKEKLEAA